MSTQIWIDAGIIILACGYLIVGRSVWRDFKAERRHRQEMIALEKTIARAKQVREFAESRFWP